MSAKKSGGSSKPVIEHLKKKTSTSGKSHMVKLSSMNKSKKRSFKEYRGQGK